MPPNSQGPVPDRGPELISIMWSLTSLALVTAILRIVVRTRNRMFGWDDIFMIFSMVCPYVPLLFIGSAVLYICFLVYK